LAGDGIYATWREVQAGARLQRSNAHGGFWILSRFDDVEAAARDTSTFSSANGVFLPSIPLSLVLEQDPPEHGAYRRLLMSFLSRRRVQELGEFVQKRSDELVTSMLQGGGGDFVSAVAEALPIEVIARAMGLSSTAGRHLRELTISMWTEVLSGVLEGPARRQLLQTFQDELDARRAAPTEDFLSHLLIAEIDGRSLTDDERLNMLYGAAIAGHETTVNAASNLVIDLARSNELQVRLRSRPDLIPSFVEESLRLRAPIQWFFRTLTRDHVIDGVKMSTGDRVMLAWGAANRDSRRFEDPDSFRAERPDAARHLSFGSGPHRCIGAPLAQLELECLTRSLVGAGDFSIVEPVTWRVHGGTHFGAESVVLSFNNRDLREGKSETRLDPDATSPASRPAGRSRG